ncbi:MAG: hypothetical protein NC203_03470 [Firmicutes bacterium]|nr:hypothetical protein [[Eubacterium] siraeum]MCM1487405.1 hypothetical protein [Bacillota bacterium]
MSKNQTSAAPKKGFKEFIRKFIVSLKRSPHNIAMVALAVAFLVYSLNLTSISNTTARVNSPNMGQCEFAAMLFSILAFVCMLRAFPKRQKANKIMLTLLFIMLIGLVAVDCVYILRINQAMLRTENPLVITPELAYIAIANNAIVAHIVCVGICALLLATLPLYGKLLKKINTSIDVEGNGEMEVIDISGED